MAHLYQMNCHCVCIRTEVCIQAMTIHELYALCHNAHEMILHLCHTVASILANISLNHIKINDPKLAASISVFKSQIILTLICFFFALITKSHIDWDLKIRVNKAIVARAQPGFDFCRFEGGVSFEFSTDNRGHFANPIKFNDQKKSSVKMRKILSIPRQFH